MLSVGIGVITRNRTDVLLDTVQSIMNTADFAKYNAKLVVGIDRDPLTEKACDKHGLDFVRTPAPGIAANRNVTVHALKDCNIIVLFEDDFRPKLDGWLDRIVHALVPGDIPYLLNLWESVHGVSKSVVYAENTDVLLYPNSTTYMIAFTQSTLNTVGYWSPEFGDRYGFEEAEWGLRVKKAFGWNPDLWPSLRDTEKYFSLVSSPPSSDEKSEETRQDETRINLAVWAKLIQENLTYQPYPY